MVTRVLEDPKVWDDSKKAQELGKERSALEDTTSTVEKIDSGIKDSAELFGMARAEDDDDTLSAVAADVVSRRMSFDDSESGATMRRERP